jgi:hypothetical protein
VSSPTIPPSLPRPAIRLAALVLLAALGGCYRKVTEPASFCRPYTGTAPLTIRGVSPGQSAEAVVALLGSPERRGPAGYGRESLQWQRFSDMVVTVDTKTHRVTEVLGNRLDAGGESVISSGMNEADVRAVLGKPAKSHGHYRPSGSGVISLGQKRIGASLSYRRDGNDAEITLNDDSVAYIRLRPPAP